MSGEPISKRSKNMFKDRKWNHYKKQNRKNRIEIGDVGFLATCNFREKDCVRESYNILNTYADQLYGGDVEAPVPSMKSEDEDISTELENEIEAMKSTNKTKVYRFQQVDSETSNLVFIKTTLTNQQAVELGSTIITDIVATKKSISRFLLRFIPIEVVCKATIEDIKNAAGKLFDKHFLNCPPKSYSIVVNKRYNNSVKRDDIISELAELVSFKNVKHKVDLKNAEFSVIVEILKGICCLSVLPNYLKWKKYNISEIVSDKPDKDEETPVKVDSSLKNEPAEDDENDTKNVAEDTAIKGDSSLGNETEVPKKEDDVESKKD